MSGINESLKLIILPTEECNFRCKYCYEHFEIGKMWENVVWGVKNLIDQRSQNLKNLRLDWFGGGPLLAFDIIQEVMNFARKKSREFNFELSSGMTTNASLLTKQRQMQLIDMGIANYQISFDGDSDLHNRFRVTRRDTSTFDIIYKNLIDFHESELNAHIVIRLHVNKDNEKSLRSLINRISLDFENDNRFSIFIRGLERLGSANDDTLPILDNEEEKHDLIKSTQEYTRSLGLSLYGHESAETPVCYAASFNSWVIRATGDVSKCTVALYDKINTVGHLSEDGKIKIDKEKLEYWLRGQFSGNKEELYCPYSVNLNRNYIYS